MAGSGGPRGGRSPHLTIGLGEDTNPGAVEAAGQDEPSSRLARASSEQRRRLRQAAAEAIESSRRGRRWPRSGETGLDHIRTPPTPRISAGRSRRRSRSPGRSGSRSWSTCATRRIRGRGLGGLRGSTWRPTAFR